ncbi:patatin-like phospholipase family protein [Legionella jordanis]|nr:patatin-like phospholipase family protein [Legionella jordanis]
MFYSHTSQQSETLMKKKQRANQLKLNQLNLALEGGATHGAFIWGVLDRLLDEPDFKVEGIASSSAGSYNATILASALLSGGPAEAKKALKTFWESFATMAPFTPFHRGVLDRLIGHWNLDFSTSFLTYEWLSRALSPYLNVNPLMGIKNLLEEVIDFDNLRKSETKLFVFATNVTSGKARIFKNDDITPDVLIASSSLPTLFPATEVNGEEYWDGGYTGNPSLRPLVEDCASKDIILVHINPQHRNDVPVISPHIINRANEVAFSVRIATELYFIELLKENPDSLSGEANKWAETKVHPIYDQEVLELDYSTKFNADFEFINFLFNKGRNAAEAFLIDQGLH